jgi:outer membrane protein insertion porin family/translocation and assembly module TamA
VLALRLRAGAVLGRSLNFSDGGGFVPPQERLYAGGPSSVRGFQQNELGSLVYIARAGEIDTDTLPPLSGPDTLYRFKIKPANSGPERVVPLGGNSLIVANLEYRLRDPFFFPDLLQYVFFVDGGDVWTRGGATSRGLRMKWTPGIGIRALTPVGPVQVNVGWNGHPREDGSIYYNPDVTTLQCVSPNNGVLYKKVAGQLVPDTPASCPASYTPPPRTGWQRLTFTFSIGSDF